MKLSGIPGKLGVFGLVMALGAGSAMAQARVGEARSQAAQGVRAQADDRELIGSRALDGHREQRTDVDGAAGRLQSR